ncbi:MAG: uracil-DNA glycosylase [Nitrososphaerales archaeon]
MNRIEALNALSAQIIGCNLCPRLVQHRVKVALNPPKRYRDEEYWAKPLPGFGDPYAKLLILGLAPAAHGGNRTGRMFTGDSSGAWLVKALYEIGCANMPMSVSRSDGLVLNGVYVSAVVRCVPPANKPLTSEVENCSRYLKAELDILRDVKVVLALGRLAHNTYLRVSGLVSRPFKHGQIIRFDGHSRILVDSYHPSRQNTQTGRLTWSMWINVFRDASRLAC